MRWNKKQLPKTGDTRVWKGFLLFPRTIKNETRWLEKAKINQEYICREFCYDHGDPTQYVFIWQDISWEN